MTEQIKNVENHEFLFLFVQHMDSFVHYIVLS